MKKMIVLCAAALILSALPSFGQGAPAAGQAPGQGQTPAAAPGQGQAPAGQAQGQARQKVNPDTQTAQLDAVLNLDQNQKTQIRAIINDQFEAMMKLRADKTIPAADINKKAQDLKDTTAARIKPLLTPDQLTKYNQFLAKNAQSQQGGSGGPPQGAPQGNAPAQPAR